MSEVVEYWPDIYWLAVKFFIAVDDFVKLQVANNIELRVQKSSVGATLPKGTLKSLDSE